jgi:hypothetical protein
MNNFQKKKNGEYFLQLLSKLKDGQRWVWKDYGYMYVADSSNKTLTAHSLDAYNELSQIVNEKWAKKHLKKNPITDVPEIRVFDEGESVLIYGRNDDPEHVG